MIESMKALVYIFLLVLIFGINFFAIFLQKPSIVLTKKLKLFFIISIERKLIASTTPYKHKLLIAVTFIPLRKLLPLAFAVVNEETNESWHWFLQHIGTYITLDKPTCLISHRCGLIRKGARLVPAFSEEHGVCHQYCIRYL